MWQRADHDAGTAAGSCRLGDQPSNDPMVVSGDSQMVIAETASAQCQEKMPAHTSVFDRELAKSSLSQPSSLPESATVIPNALSYTEHCRQRVCFQAGALCSWNPWRVVTSLFHGFGRNVAGHLSFDNRPAKCDPESGIPVAQLCLNHIIIRLQVELHLEVCIQRSMLESKNNYMPPAAQM